MTRTRRDFLRSAAAIPVLSALGISRAYAEEVTGRPAPYLALEKFIQPGSDEFPEEKTAAEIESALEAALRSRILPLAENATGTSPMPREYRALAADLHEADFDRADTAVSDGWRRWIDSLGPIRRAQFYSLPENVVRFEVASQKDARLRYHVGHWKQTWKDGRLTSFIPQEEHVASAPEFLFRDVTASVLQGVSSFEDQLLRGIPYWRSHLDPATGIDLYGSNGIAAGDIDNDGCDEIYVCQPGGLPNRLFKYDPEGTRLIDITQTWKVGILDDTSCALFLDLRNTGRQDLIVLRASGPVLLLNEGGRFRLREDAFRFATTPRGGFTGMAAADFDRDGKLDLYLCCYVYFLSEAQYTYAVPYHDAQNGPPNFLFRNRLNPDGTGSLDDCTAETGIDENNNRFSFAPAWCDFNDDGWPDLYVANDFGRKNFYVNHEGRFRDRAAAAGVEDIGPGMSASWFDCDHDGKPDLYVANMWTDAGQRVITDPQFAPAKSEASKGSYRAHTMGNSMYQNAGDGSFRNVTSAQNAGFGRWAWASGGHDLDNDGNPEIFVTCGMLTNQSNTDLNSFFWRQVVDRSPASAVPSSSYENGWNALNQFVRENFSWNGHEPNVLHVRRGSRYFDFSGVSGLDFADDSRAFAVTDFDGDGRPDILLKSRLGPQFRVLQNNCAGPNRSIAFSLRGTRSNRDAIGARIQVDGQTKWLEAGSGFLSQHSKRVLFGLGPSTALAESVRIKWPSGLIQEFHSLRSGGTYSIVEGSPDATFTPFREPRSIPSLAVKGSNQLELRDTWFLEPLPLPEPQTGLKLFVLDDLSKLSPQRRDQYGLFRRYLFDWRTHLVAPIAFLLNKSGDAVKVYGSLPSQQQVAADLRQIEQHAKLALPFEGEYLSQTHRDFFKFGAAFLWAGYFEQALPYLQRVLQRNPDNARVLVLVGRVHWEAGRFDAAAESYTKAHNIDPRNVPALLGMGDVAAKRNDQADAAQYYRQALDLDSQSPEAANGLGLSLGKQEHYNEARKYLQLAITLRHDYAEAINNLGVLYTQQGSTNDAIAAFEYGVREAPDEDILYLNLGRVYVQSGQMEKARQTMQQLLERKPDNSIARRALEQLSGK